MKKDENTKVENTEVEPKKKLVLRKDSIRALDNVDLSLAAGGGIAPPDGGVPPAYR